MALLTLAPGETSISRIVTILRQAIQYINALTFATLPGSVNLTSQVTGILPVANGGTANAGVAWTSWTPTVTPAAGAITSYTVNSASYQKIGKLVSFHFDITITNAGTGSGHLFTTLPVTARAQIQMGFAQEIASTGKSAFFVIGAAGADFTKGSSSYYDNTTLIATNNEIACSCTYESA